MEKKDDVWYYNKSFIRNSKYGIEDNNDFMLSPLIEIPQNTRFTCQGQTPYSITGSHYGAPFINEYDSNKKECEFWGASLTSYIGIDDNGYRIYKRSISNLYNTKSKYIRVSISKKSYKYCKVWIEDKLVFDGENHKPSKI